MLDLLLHAVLAYLLGSISGSLLIGRLRQVDIRKMGSGNAGGTNAFRTQGPWFALAVVLIDIGKGIAAIVLLPKIPLLAPHPDLPWVIASCGMGVVIGHIWPIYHGFRGGKGGATAVGAVGALSPPIILPLLVVWVSTLVLTGYVGLATILAAVILWPSLLWLNPSPVPAAYSVMSLVISVLIIHAHRDNIRRLLAGNENRFNKARIFRRRS